MASRRITRDSFEAVVQDKVKRYRSGAAGDPGHRFAAPSRLPRPRYHESFQHDGRFPAAECQPQDWSQEPGEDYPGESYPGESYPGEDYPGHSYPGPSYRAASPLPRKENYFHGHFSRPALREREFGQDYRKFGRAAAPSREFGQRPAPHGREYGQREYRGYGPSSGCWEPGGQHAAGFGSPELLGDFRSPGLVEEEEYGSVEDQEHEAEDGEFRARRGGAGRARGLRGKRPSRGVLKAKVFKGDLKSPLKKWSVKKAQPGLDPKALEQPLEVGEQRPGPLQQHPKLPPQPVAAQRAALRLPKPAHVFRNLNLDLVDKSDIFSTFGMEIIRWAGFHAVRSDAEFSRLFGALFELETETCAKMLASFKCSLRPEHRDYCFFTIKSLQHAALKTPKVDNEFLNMLLDKGAVKTKNCFFEIIKPFDKYIMRLQDRLLKGVTPLLMACNAYELSLKTNGFSDPREMAGAFETTVSLCRKSLALLGQTFALASGFRQEKILEAVGLQEMAPAPAAFPNFDDSTLFGREYIEHLKAWLDKSGCPIQMRKAGAGAGERLGAASPEGRAPQRADRKVLDTIEQLVSSIVAGTWSAKDRNAQKNSPEYWFLCDKDSLEYKYYRLRLSEAQRSGLAGEAAAPEALRAMLYARRVARIKRRLFKRKKAPGLVPARARRARRASAGTQSLLSAGTAGKQPEKSLSVCRAVKQPEQNIPAGTAVKQPNQNIPAGTAVKQPNQNIPAGTAVKQPDKNVPAGTGGKQPEQNLSAGTGVKHPDKNVPAGTGGKQPEQNLSVCRGVKQPDRNLTAGTGQEQPDQNVPAGTGLEQPDRNLSAGTGLEQPHQNLSAGTGPDKNLAAGTGMKHPDQNLSPGTGLEQPHQNLAAGTGMKQPEQNLAAGTGLEHPNQNVPAGTGMKQPHQTVPAGTGLEQPHQTVPGAEPGPAQPGPGAPQGASSSCPVPAAAEGRADAQGLAADPEGSQFADVDARTMQTAEKLARFVAQVGPEIEQFSIDNSADNPELW
uniref:SURP and G-patch domain containing 2 n=1 Tax=Junco hyemalis TaxID=40217 RepID=A0A8C5ITJ0_JUNHY